MPTIQTRALLALSATLAIAPALGAQSTTRVSVSSTGAAGVIPPSASYSCTVALSEDGRWAAFSSLDPTLVPGDTNNAEDVFLRDLQTGVTTRISVDSTGAQAHGTSNVPAISDDGRVIAFQSTAPDLVAGDQGLSLDVFVHDRLSGQTTRASVDSAGGPAGSYGNWWDSAVGISGDGRYVCFSSQAAIAPDDTNAHVDTYVHDRQLGITTRVSLPVAAGTQFLAAHSILGTLSADGQRVAWIVVPDSTGLSEALYVRDLVTQQTTLVSLLLPGDPSLSADGRYLAYSRQTSGSPLQVVRHDLQTSLIDDVSVDNAGFLSNGISLGPRLSPDGRYVLFHSRGTNLGSSDADWDVFVRDVQLGTTELVSVDTAGGDHPGSSGTIATYADLAMDGRLVIFSSSSAGLVPDVTSAQECAYVHDRAGGPSSSYCVSKVNSQGCVPRMTFSGVPSASSAQPYLLGAGDVLNNVLGVMIHSPTANGVPFQGGILCVGPQVKRTAAQSSGGSSGAPDCSGALQLDFNAVVQSGVDPDLQAGASVFAQYWSRDPASPIASNLTDAVWFVIQP